MIENFKYVKELQDKGAIANFEKYKNIKFPADFVELVTANNGGRPNKNIIDTSKNKERIFKTLLSFNKNDKETIYTALEALNDSKNNDLIPFASTPSGDFFCFDNEMRIVLWLHETDKTEFVADNFSQMLGKLYSI